jgi:hypothetical protein
MPNNRSEWQEHVKNVEREYGAARFAIERLRDQAHASPDILGGNDPTRKHLARTLEDLEGTYIVRLFAAFEAALRSYDRARHNDPDLNRAAAVLIDATGGRRGQGISDKVRAGAHAVREVRNFWAHESNEMSNPLTIAEARSRLERFLSWLPHKWG